jgi:hypothetical protein
LLRNPKANLHPFTILLVIRHRIRLSEWHFFFFVWYTNGFDYVFQRAFENRLKAVLENLAD